MEREKLKKKILLVEDDEDLGRYLVQELGALGYEIQLEQDGLSGANAALTNSYELIILDMMLPGLEGTEVCKRIRQRNTEVPIIVLSAKDETISKVLLLELGADDYITKPFEVSELKARIHANLRRGANPIHSDDGPKRSVFGDLVIDNERKEVLMAGEPVDLTAREYDFLSLLSIQPHRVYTRDEINEALFGYNEESFARSINSLVARLRAKLKQDAERPEYVITIRGIGYRLQK